MSSERLRDLDKMLAELLRQDSPISPHVEPVLAAMLEQTSGDESVSTEPIEIGNAATMTEQPDSALARLDLNTAIRLRWALRDIKANRTKLSPISPDDL